MALKAACTSGNWSTAATWESIANTPSQHVSTNITINTTLYTAAFTAPNLINTSTGCALFLAGLGTAGTVTITLQQNSAGWVDCSPAATGSFNVATLYAAVGATMNNWVNVRFGTPFVFLSLTASYYRFKITVSGMTGTTSGSADSGGANLAYIATYGATGVPAATDEVFIFSTCSVDGSQTIGNGSLTAACTTMRVATGTNFWGVNIGYGGELNFDNTASATLNCKGCIAIGTGGTFRMDDKSGGAYASAYTAKLYFNGQAALVDFGIGIFDNSHVSCVGQQKSTTTLWKTNPNVSWDTNHNGTTGKEAVAHDTVNWTINDQLVVVATDAYNHTEEKFIKTIVTGNTMTFSSTVGGGESGLSYTHTTDAWVLNITRNVVIGGSAGYSMYINNYNTIANGTNFNWTRFELIGANNSTKYGITKMSSASKINLNYSVIYSNYGAGFCDYAGSVATETYNGLIVYGYGSNQNQAGFYFFNYVPNKTV